MSVLSSVGLWGCGKDGPDRYELTGEVTYQGRAVPVGTIIFIPDESRGNRGPATTAGISNGQYKTLPGQGTIGGPHTVRISGYDDQVKAMPGAPGEQTIPANPPLFENVELKVDLPRSNARYDFHLPPGKR